MQLKDDFHSKLAEYGQLPVSNLEMKFQQMKEMQELRDQVKELKLQIERLKPNQDQKFSFDLKKP